MRHDIPPPHQRSKTSLSLPVSGLKVFEPNELFFNYSCKRHTSSLGSSLLIIFINPPISSIQQWRKLLLQFRLILRPPQPHYLSSSKSPLLLPFPFILSTTPETQYTCTSRQSHTHICTQEKKKGTHRHEHTHTLTSLVCVGGYQFDTGHCDYVFSVLQSEGGDKGPADYSEARHHSSHMGREWWSGGCKGDSGWRPVS